LELYGNSLAPLLFSQYLVLVEVVAHDDPPPALAPLLDIPNFVHICIEIVPNLILIFSPPSLFSHGYVNNISLEINIS